MSKCRENNNCKIHNNDKLLILKTFSFDVFPKTEFSHLQESSNLIHF